MTKGRSAQARRAWVEQIMGMPISLHLRGPDLNSPEVEQRVAAVFSELNRLEQVFSPYRDDSDLSRWERGELQLAAADPALAEVCDLCEQARERTRGWFDPRGLPDQRGRGFRYDPTGLVKGWAVQTASRRLATLSGHGWCLNAGGDILVTTPAGGPVWRVGIEDPADPGQLLQAIGLAAGAVATSGSTHRGAHIIDPRTREPATAVRSATVVGPELLWADVFATAAVASGPDAIGWLEELDGYQALLVDAAGGVQTTAGWPATVAGHGDRRGGTGR